VCPCVNRRWFGINKILNDCLDCVKGLLVFASGLYYKNNTIVVNDACTINES